MKHLDVRIDLGAESGDDTRPSVQAAEGRLQALRDRIRENGEDHEDHIRLRLDEAALLVELRRYDESFECAHRMFHVCVAARDYESAARACDLMFQCDRPQSLAALGQGIWLAVTFPVDPALTVALLSHLVEETPDHSDGAAVAAATAFYVTELRGGERQDELRVAAGQMLTEVARRHGEVQDQADLDHWMQRLELNNPDQFLPRLRNVIDVLVQGTWWLDTESIHAELPVQ